jgi:hypothetical protein
MVVARVDFCADAPMSKYMSAGMYVVNVGVIDAYRPRSQRPY